VASTIDTSEKPSLAIASSEMPSAAAGLTTIEKPGSRRFAGSTSRAGSAARGSERRAPSAECRAIGHEHARGRLEVASAGFGGPHVLRRQAEYRKT